jgi:hypothetical protein
MRNSRARPSIPPKLVRFFPSRQDHERVPALNVYMFTEDIANLMPIGGGRRNKSFSVELKGNLADSQRAMQILKGIPEHSGQTPEEIVCRVVDEIAKRVSWEGRAQFELIPYDDGTVFFHGITSIGLIQACGHAVQFLSLEDWKFWGGRRWRITSNSNLWQVDIPASLGGRTRYRRTLARLKRINNLGPEFWQRDISTGKNPAAFDLQGYARMNNVARSILTKQWGWNYRDWSTESTTEFYNLYRRATAEKAKILFREHILSELNRLLLRLGINCKINTQGLLTLADIDELQKDLLSGEISFSHFLDKIHGR